MSNIAFLFLPLAFSSLPAVLPFVSPSSQVLPSRGRPAWFGVAVSIGISLVYHRGSLDSRKFEEMPHIMLATTRPLFKALNIQSLG